MPHKIETLRRAQVQRYKELSSAEKRRKADATMQTVQTVLQKAHTVLADQTFLQLLRSQGVPTIPGILAEVGSDTPELELDPSLTFTVAWAFLFPLFGNPAIAKRLDETWPDFTLQMKDAFIALVLDGPFPQPASIFELKCMMERTRSALG